MLSTLNPHPLDDETAFDEASHTYTHTKTGRKFPKSVTYLVKKAFPGDFNADEVVESNITKWASNSQHKYYSLIRYCTLVLGLSLEETKNEIKKLWSAEGEEARTEGTDMHFALENWMNGANYDEKYRYAVSMVENAFRMTFYKNMELKPYRTEFRVFLTIEVEHPKAPGIKNIVPVLSGTIDALFRDKHNRLWIFDWKRTDPSKKGKLGTETVSMFTKKGADLFKPFSNTDFSKYSLQLILYKLMLERGGYLKPGEEVAACFLCQVHPSMHKPHIVQVLENMDENEQELFELSATGLLNAHIEACKKKELERLESAMDAETEGEDDEVYANPTASCEDAGDEVEMDE